MNFLLSKFSKIFLLLFAVSAFVVTACDKDNNDGNNDQELITTVRLTFTEVGGGSSTFTVKDLDGDGGNPPIADTIKLKANTAYTIGVEFLDESEANHTHDITEEVKKEAEEHLVCFAASGAMSVPIAGDQDGNGKPLGLENALTTGAAGTGSLQVSLKHEPDKSAANPCTTGETDAEVTFDVTVQ